MKEYHKIQTVFQRDQATHHKTLLEGSWSLPEFEYLSKNQWVFTEKVDGTNIRVIITPEGKVSFGGKTDNAQIPAFLVERLQDRFLSQSAVLTEIFPSGGCLYGEGYGAKIQKGGGNYRPDPDFVLFDVAVGGWWLDRTDVEDVAIRLSLDVVPIIGVGTLFDMVSWTRRGFDSAWGQFKAEGIVARPQVELCTRGGNRLITKIKFKDFL